MSTLKMKKTKMMLVLMLGGAICLSWISMSCTFLQAKDKVTQAYELRMDGHADSALLLLDEIILSEPDNAKAYYERARAGKHLMLAAGKQDIEPIIADAAKASELDPESEIYAYFSARMKFLAVYIDIMQGKEEVSEKLDDAIVAFERVLELDPCCASVLVSLTEIYAMLPPEMGGEQEKAVFYSNKLSTCNAIQGLRADALLLDEENGLLEFWLEEYEANETNAIISEELGRAYLLAGDMENGKKYIEETISLDPETNIILIDLGRAYAMTAMQSSDKAMAEKAIEIFQQYIELEPDAPAPVKAFAYGMMSLSCKRILGDEVRGNEFAEKKDALDPFCSRAFGSPGMELFVRPDVLSDDVEYYSRPF
jgi:tetratricopeptide (TPR) repeat protein